MSEREPAREIATDREVSEAALATLVDTVARGQSESSGVSPLALGIQAGPTSDPMHIGDDAAPLVCREAVARGLLYQPDLGEFRVPPGSHPAASVDGGGAGD